MSRHTQNQSAKESAKEAAAHSEKRRPTAGLSGAAQATTSAQARRLIEEEHDRRWAYQPDSSQDSSFQSRFLSYAD